MADANRASNVNEAAARFADALAESYRISTDRPPRPRCARGASPGNSPSG
jgi:hypothetical protein